MSLSFGWIESGTFGEIGFSNFHHVVRFDLFYSPEVSRQRVSSSSSQDDVNNALSQSAKSKKKKLSTVDKSKKRLFSKPVVLKLLAELTKSYPVVAKLITDHVYMSKGNEKTSKVCCTFFL